MTDQSSRFNREASRNGLSSHLSSHVKQGGDGVLANLPNDMNAFPQLSPRKPVPEHLSKEDAESEAKPAAAEDWPTLKKRELLKENFVNVEKMRKDNAILGERISNGFRRPLPRVSNDDPLAQLQYKVEELNVQRPSLSDNLSQKSLERVKNKMAAESSQRKLLNEENKRGMFEEHNKEMLHRLKGPGMDRIKQKFGLAFDKRVENKPRDNPQDAQKMVYSHIPALGDFDVESYLSAQRMKEGDGDPMKNFQFNQVASDGMSPDRHLKDVRSPL